MKTVLNEDMTDLVPASPLCRGLQTTRLMMLCALVPLVSPLLQNCPQMVLPLSAKLSIPHPLPKPLLILSISHSSFSLPGSSRLVQTACWHCYVAPNILLHYTLPRLHSYTYLDIFLFLFFGHTAQYADLSFLTRNGTSVPYSTSTES